MPPPAVRERKRQRPRTVAATEAEEGAGQTDDEGRHCSEDLVQRPGQAERKRELERNRRNLVNVRFVELEAELRRCMPRPDPPAPDDVTPVPAKGKRIDKEAVLKDAAQRLAVQRKDLAVAAERMAAMSVEIGNLRAEKVELRGDKNYLRAELETVRGDVQRLRSDNINLWQAFKKASSFKDAFAPDVAKIPAELFLRSGTEQLSATAPVSSAMVQQCLQTTHAMPPHSAPQVQLNTSSIPPPTASQAPVQQQPCDQGQIQQQQVSTSSALLSDAPARETQQAGMLSQPTVQTANSTMNTDSFLILQTPEELGELFSNYVPGAMATNLASSSPQRAEVAQNANSIRSTQSIGLSMPPPSFPQTPGFGQTQFISDSPILGKTFAAQQNPFAGLNAGDTAPGSSPKAEKEEAEKQFSDVAYCV